MQELETFRKIVVGVMVTLITGGILWMANKTAAIDAMKRDISANEASIDDHEDRIRVLERE